MIRNFEPCLSKDVYTTKSIQTKADFHTQLKSVAQCGLSIASDCPVFGAFYTNMFRQNEAGKIDDCPVKDGKYWLAQRMPKLSTEITPLTRASFFIAFGISPLEQQALERYYSSIKYEFNKSEIQTCNYYHL